MRYAASRSCKHKYFFNGAVFDFENMGKSIGYCPAKRLKTIYKQSKIFPALSKYEYVMDLYNQDFRSAFGCLSGELILDLFEYLNTKEILQSYFTHYIMYTRSTPTTSFTS
jgi:hypothetical protein